MIDWKKVYRLVLLVITFEVGMASSVLFLYMMGVLTTLPNVTSDALWTMVGLAHGPVLFFYLFHRLLGGKDCECREKDDECKYCK